MPAFLSPRAQLSALFIVHTFENKMTINSNDYYYFGPGNG